MKKDYTFLTLGFDPGLSPIVSFLNFSAAGLVLNGFEVVLLRPRLTLAVTTYGILPKLATINLKPMVKNILKGRVKTE